MKLLALEFCKCRRRKLTLVCAGLLAAQLLWFGAYLTRQDAEALAQGWMLLLYNLAMVDAIMLPIGVAVIASRSCELEHRGHTLKLLETAVTPGRLYAAKLAWGALVLAGLLLARGALFLALGLAMGFPGGTPWGRFVVFTALSWAVSMTLYALQQGLSLRFVQICICVDGADHLNSHCCQTFFKISGAKIGIYNIQIHQYHLLSFSTEIHCKIYRKIGFSTAIMSGNNGNSFD